MKSAERRQRMLQYVRTVEPAALLEEFLIKEHPMVIEAMRQTISNMLGTITTTPQFFTVTISTVGENLAMLMNTVMLTGYMFKSAEERLRLRNVLGGGSGGGGGGGGGGAEHPTEQQQLQQQPAMEPLQWRASGSSSGAGSGGGSTGGGVWVNGGGVLDDKQYAPGIQKSRVQGDVLMWHKENGVEAMPAVEYIELLEAEVLRLRQAAAKQAPPRLPPAAAWGLEAPAPPAPQAPPPPEAAGRSLPQVYGERRQALAVRPHDDRNELLDFIRSLEPATVSDLTSCAAPETAAAMDAFVERLLGLGGGADRDALRRAASESSATEMRQLLFWLLVVGWRLRAMEVEVELQRM